MPSPALHIGVDFDNTIVSYDALFHRVALERNLIPADLPINKSEVRNYLRRAGKEDVWTEMQGCVYGGRMSEAAPYPGVIEFFLSCRRAGITLSIISHKTRHPFLGERHDLHQAAMKWLHERGFFDSSKIGLPAGNAFFELTREAKLERIVQQGCTVFIDDLPEVFAEARFPKIERILFDPGGIYADQPDYTRAETWARIWELISGRVGDGALEAPIFEFLGRQGFGSAAGVQRLAGGGNNRVYRARDGARDAVVKQYFRHPADLRDRFGAERAFYTFVWGQGIRRTPEPLGWDVEGHLGLLSFVDGRRLAASEVNQEAVRQALDFVIEINRGRSQAGAAPIPPGSEACFSGVEHVECIEKRVRRLDQIHAETEIDRQAADFAQSSLRPAWDRIKSAIEAERDLMRELPRDQRVVSPSDFGFHNALQGPDERLRFIDFEYAGWDDPAKLICDFFCQPELPVASGFWEEFVRGVTSGIGLERTLPNRARRLLPAYRVKWCCILLNEFARTDSARRDFAKGAADQAERKAAQLAKARLALKEAVGG